MVDDSVTVVVVVEGAAVVEIQCRNTSLWSCCGNSCSSGDDSVIAVVVVKGTAVVEDSVVCNTSLWCCCGNYCSSGG